MWKCLLCVVLAHVLWNSAAQASDPCGKGELSLPPALEAKTLNLQWIGTIRAPMHERIEAQFNKAKGRVRDVVLSLSSCGGSLVELERVVAVLRRIKETHRLETLVDRGAICGSACVPVFLQGQRRRGALASTWLFHEIGQWAEERRPRVKVDRVRTEMMFQDRFLAAGVSEAWLNQLRLRVQHADYWQTGQNLWDDKSGIITDPIDNLVPRYTEEPRY